jgi:hypothetical protein
VLSVVVSGVADIALSLRAKQSLLPASLRRLAS